MKRIKTLARRIVRPFARPIWRRMLARVEFALVIPLRARVSALETHAAPLEARVSALEAHVAPLESRVSTLDTGWKEHLPAFLNAASTVRAFGHELSRERETANRQLAEQAVEIRRLDNDLGRAREELAQRDMARGGDIARLWHRLEFVRSEMMFEMRYGRNASPGATNNTGHGLEPRILAADKLAAAGENVRLNLGCGHIPLDGYINVDARELPGVDIVSDVGQLPFQAGTVREIHSAHLLEHFPQEMLRRNLLPYWKSLLAPGGRFSAIVPDGEAMLAGVAAGTYPFEEFREVLFGGQDYAGDFHFNLFIPPTLEALLREAGFCDVEVPIKGRRNGKSFEFEIHGIT